MSGKQCDECGCTHGPGNTNTMCPLASNHRKPPAAPEMPERVDGWWWDGSQYRRVDPHDDTMSLDTLRCLLKLAGLSICTEVERKVLEAMAEAPYSFIRSMNDSCDGPTVWVDWMRKVLQAELARRGAKPSGAAIGTDLQGLDPHTT